jgi:predicted amidophosphoribosyltransferase
MLLRYLDANADVSRGIDLIVPSPAYTGPGAHRSWDHLGAIVHAAIGLQGPVSRWPFDHGRPPAIVRAGEAARLAPMALRERRHHAEQVIRPLLQVPDPSRVRGARIAVLDDVYASGATLRETARTLRGRGASEVIGISLARTTADH